MVSNPFHKIRSKLLCSGGSKELSIRRLDDDEVEALTREKHENFTKPFDVILVLGGSFNPVHTQHLELLSLGKKIIENFQFDGKQKYNVVAGALVPSSYNWVKNKVGDGLVIPQDDRKVMCDLATMEHGIDDWVVKTNHVTSNAQRAGRCLRDELKLPQAKLAFLAGADAMSPIYLKGGLPDDTIMVVVGRGVDTEKFTKEYSEDNPNVRYGKFFLHETDLKSVSSTKVRNAIDVRPEALDGALNELVRDEVLHQSVANYIQDHHEKFK